MNVFLENIKQFLGRLSLRQQVALAAVLIGGVALLIGIAYWAARPEYTLLFGKLDPTDADKIVEALKSEGVSYELKENGTAIYVPRENVYELRLQFAGEGLVSDGTVGYELFDKGTLGMTDFMQKLNLKRALEGELARTISSVKQVELCRVHLVIPERSPFQDAQNQPSASVVLQLAGNGSLSAPQITGITELVAGAVEGLNPSNVTILDTRGNMLSNPEASDPEAVLTTTQLKAQRAIESHLTENGQSMLDRVLGAGNAIVRVSATLDFTRAVEEKETIDPESQTVISEETLDEQGGAAGTANSAVRNYTLSKTNSHSEKSGGDVKYLTVSVIVNHKKQPATDPDAKPEDAQVVPYTQAEITNIESLVKNAVGFNPDRGDRFAIHQTRFDTSVDDQIATELREERQEEQMQTYLRYALMLLVLGLAAFLLRSASRRIGGTSLSADPALIGGKAAQPALAGATAEALPGGSSPGAQAALEAGAGQAQIPAHGQSPEDELVLVEDVYTSKLSAEAKKRLKAKHLMYEEVKAQVMAKPAETAEVLRSWIANDVKTDID